MGFIRFVFQTHSTFKRLVQSGICIHGNCVNPLGGIQCCCCAFEYHFYVKVFRWGCRVCILCCRCGLFFFHMAPGCLLVFNGVKMKTTHFQVDLLYFPDNCTLNVYLTG